MSETTVTRQHVLPGLRPQPLASYLAGLGLIRLLGEQSDPAATAAWSEGGLVITTTVTNVAAWLVDEYVPTPVLSPWNNGSGFGPKDKEPKRTLDALRAHTSPRFAPLREAIPVAEAVSAKGRAAGWLAEGGKGDKGRAVQEFRNLCPDALLPWIDAAVVLTGKDTFFPPLLGTGGNDGRLDFSSNFHQRLLEVIDSTGKGRARSLARARDLLDATETGRLASAAVGQFDPGGAGGPGSSRFGAADSLVNPWAYVLLVEGALLFAASAVRRHEHGGGKAAIPFTVYASPDGSASGADGEETRGEIWAPVWHHPFTLAEIGQLFGEARASWRGHPARRAVEFYAATRTLGVARGVDTFVRYGLHQRNGLAFAAVPVDTVNVHTDPDVGLIAPVEDWPARFRGSDSPSAIRLAARRFEAAEMAYARDGGARALARMLAALTTLEQAVGRSGRTRDQAPVRRPPGAQPFLEILAQDPEILARDLSAGAELRVAAGIAACATLPGPDGLRGVRTMRQILLPIDPPGPGERGRTGGRWRDTPVVPGFGIRPLPQVLADVLAWRCRTAGDEADRQEFRGVPTFRSGLPVPAADLHAFARGELDGAELDLWLRACLPLDWRGVQWNWGDVGPVLPVPTLGLLHPLALGLTPRGTDSDGRRLALNPGWASVLVAGRISQVHRDATGRLRHAGWAAVPPPSPAGESAIDRSLFAAALVPRCRQPDAGQVMRMLAVPLRVEADGTGGDGGAAGPRAGGPSADPDASADLPGSAPQQ